MRTILSGVFGLLVIVAADSSAPDRAVPSDGSRGALRPRHRPDRRRRTTERRSLAASAGRHRVHPARSRGRQAGLGSHGDAHRVRRRRALRRGDGCTTASRPGSRGSWRGAIRTPKRTASRRLPRSASRSRHRCGVLRSAPPAFRATRRSTTTRGPTTPGTRCGSRPSRSTTPAGRRRCGSRSRSCGFRRAAQLTFGINAMRYIQRKKEEAWLVHVPKTESGLASRMGHLDGLDGVASASDGGTHALRREPGRVSSSRRPAIRSTTAHARLPAPASDLKYR